MRVLILSAIFACAAAAPSAPVAAIAPIIPIAIPTLSPGDLQAAAINAKVQAEDQARFIAEQARLAAEVAREQAELALRGQKPIIYSAPAAPVIAIAAPTSGDLQAAAIDAKVQAEDQARFIAEQARLAAEVAREQAVLALGGQKHIVYSAPAAPVIASPTSGDLQAAAIDAKVQAEDQARALADQAKLGADVARQQAELAAENQKGKAEEVTSIVKEKNQELFWNVEEKKWQTVDAIKTVEAKIDGAIARNALALAKSLTIPEFASLPYSNLAYYYTPLVKDEKIIKTNAGFSMYDICQIYNHGRRLNSQVVALPYTNLVYAGYTSGLTPYAIDPCAQFIRQ